MQSYRYVKHEVSLEGGDGGEPFEFSI